MKSNKTALIISREYFTRVKKKSFLLTTILVPVVMLAFYAIIIAISIKGSSEKNKVAVLDEAGLLADSMQQKNTEVVFIKNETENSFVKKYRQQGYDAFLYIPRFDLNDAKNFKLHSPASAGITLTGAIERNINKAIENKRLKAQGINKETYEKISADVDVENIVDTDKGSKKSMAGIASVISFVCGMLIYLMMIIYGTQVMRGVMEEKTNRIAEVVISSVKPFQLMVGKILGIGAVGLTQFVIWIVLMIALQGLTPLFFHDSVQQMTNAAASVEGASSKLNILLDGLASLPLLKIALCFLFYFIGGYLTYASLFAAVGSMASDDQQETQQLMFPILMPIIIGFVIMTKAINDPQSGLAVFGSLFPLTSPIVMMGRITYDVPAWQLAVSMILLIGCFIFLTWLTGKIYRTGILMYGKKPSWKETMRWMIKG